LSDTLGLSIVLDAINQRHEEESTESSLLGPFYRDGVKEAEFGADIAQTEGDPRTLARPRSWMWVEKPIAGALIEVWQTAANGMYEGTGPRAPEGNLRGRFHSNAAGEYAFARSSPTSYPIPTDGPVGPNAGRDRPPSDAACPCPLPNRGARLRDAHDRAVLIRRSVCRFGCGCSG